MQYFVIGPDGAKFGPADVTQLAQWAIQGRINAFTILEDTSTGERIAAANVPGIFPPSAPPYTSPPPTFGTTPPNFGGQPFVSGIDAAASAHAAPYSVPEAQLGGWNWGAFVFTWIWGLNHKAYLTLLAFVPYVGFAVAIWAGIKGNQWAWESGRFGSIEEMQVCQAVWRTWGIAWLIGGAVLFAIALMIPIFFAGSGGFSH